MCIKNRSESADMAQSGGQFSYHATSHCMGRNWRVNLLRKPDGICCGGEYFFFGFVSKLRNESMLSV